MSLVAFECWEKANTWTRSYPYKFQRRHYDHHHYNHDDRALAHLVRAAHNTLMITSREIKRERERRGGSLWVSYIGATHSIVVDFFRSGHRVPSHWQASAFSKTAAAMSYSRQLLSVTGKPSVGNVFLPTIPSANAFIVREIPLRFGHARRKK